MLVFAAHTASAIAVVAIDWTGVMENQLADTLTHRQYDAFVHVEIVDLERDTVDIARIDSTGVKTDCDAVSTPAAAAFDFAGAAMRTDTDKLVGVRQDALTGT